MKKISKGLALILLLCASAFCNALEKYEIHDFEKDTPRESPTAWGGRGGLGWCDAQSNKRPEWKIVDGGAEGKRSLRFEYYGCKKYQGVTVPLGKMPQNADGIVFWCKVVSGRPPSHLILAEKSENRKGREIFQTTFSLPLPGSWKEITIPLSSFRYGWQNDEPNGNQKIDHGREFSMQVIGYTAEPGVLQIDALRWKKSKQGEAETETRTNCVNRLQGDTSFETGVGPWMPSPGLTQLNIRKGDASFGDSCLELPPKSQMVMCKWLWRVFQPGKSYVFSFYAKSAPGQEVSAFALNFKWRCLSSKKFKLTSEWKRYSVVVSPQKQEETAYFAFSIYPPRRSPVLIDAVQLEEGTVPTAYTATEAVSLFSSVQQTGEIVTEGEVPKLAVCLRNNSAGKNSLPLTLKLELPGKWSVLKNLDLKPQQLQELKFPCDFATETGYYPVELTLYDKNGTILKHLSSPFVVAPVFPAIEKNKGFFGMQDSSVAREALSKIGVSWLRASARHWIDSEPKRGKFQNMEQNPEDYAGLNVQFLVGNIQDVPLWARQKNSEAANPPEFRAYAEQLILKTRKFVSCYDLQNEPDLTLRHIKGMNREKAIKYYSDLLKVMHPVAEKLGVKVMINAAGDGAGFSSGVFAQAADSFDIYGPHPYGFPRTISMDGRYCVSPENSGLMEKLKAAVELIRKHGKKHTLAIGELGWALDGTAPFRSIQAKRLAAYLARAFLLARTIPECSWFIWYSGLGYPENGNYEYGVWRNENGIRPLPAAAAYAQVAREAEGGGEFQLVSDREIKIIRWKKNGKEKIAIWNMDENTREIPFHVNDATIRDIYGTPVKNGRFMLGDSPFYLTAKSGDGDRVVAGLLENIAKRLLPIQVYPLQHTTKLLGLLIRNNLPHEWSGVLSVKGGEQLQVTLAGKETRMVAAKIPETTKMDAWETELAVRGGDGSSFQLPIRLPKLTAIPKVNMSDWKTFDFLNAKPQIVFKDRSYMFPPDPFIKWDGPQDLSAQVFLGWDETYFYLMAEVLDDEHNNPYRNERLWNGDSIQFAFDTRNDAIPNGEYDNNDYEFGIALGSKLWCWKAPPGKSVGPAVNVKSLVEKNGDGKMIYRVAIPWEELAPLTAGKGKIFGFSLIIHDRDGEEHYRYMAFGQGIASGKNPSQFRKMVLTGK